MVNPIIIAARKVIAGRSNNLQQLSPAGGIIHNAYHWQIAIAVVMTTVITIRSIKLSLGCPVKII